MMPFIMFFVDKDAITERPKIASMKFSCGPNSKAILASLGAANSRTRIPNTEPIRLDVVDSISASFARP